MKVENVAFMSEGQRISGILHLPWAKSFPCVIASHGLLSSKNSEKYIALGERLSSHGIAMLRFDFRGVGESEGRIEDDTITRRIADLGSAIDFIRSYLGRETPLGLVGSSLGGYVTLIRGSADQEIKAIVIWATPFHLDDLGSKKQKEDYPLPAEAFFKDLPRHRLLPLLPKVSNCLVIHGDQDEAVPVDQAWEIFHVLGAPKEIHIIEGADHRITEPAHRQRAIDLTVEWFKKHL
ncbi:MAG: alpha/beta hydrolase [Syntrophaceae bacterium]|nr:alpha/beta hydrolase [Syntrophaceae bacterium]